MICPCCGYDAISPRTDGVCSVCFEHTSSCADTLFARANRHLQAQDAIAAAERAVIEAAKVCRKFVHWSDNTVPGPNDRMGEDGSGPWHPYLRIVKDSPLYEYPQLIAAMANLSNAIDSLLALTRAQGGGAK